MTNDAPDTTPAPEDRWQHIEDRLTALDHRIRELGNAATATLDTHLARLEVLRHNLAHQPWPPNSWPGPADRPAETPPHHGPAPTESRPEAAPPATDSSRVLDQGGAPPAAA
ncbi:hypothetical protein OG535_29730 [Kitasatospora sp. NBC_00085]|uniref:hypothetical protein n=1 Tax=unclassified Kitasatospora TaxID=2633591 RepID=UPI003253E8E5